MNDRMECEIEPKRSTYLVHWMVTLACFAASIAVGTIANYEAGENAKEATALAQRATDLVERHRAAAQQAQEGTERAQRGWERCIAAASYITPSSVRDGSLTNLEYDTARCHVVSSRLVMGYSYISLADGCWVATTCR